MKKYLLPLLACLVLLPQISPAEKTTYSNPVISGDYPDPSVIRVNQDYWATATTSDWAPLFPLLHSTDLVNWTQVGNVFKKRPEWAVGMFWAPEISQYQGKYYVYYVGRRRNGPLSIAVATSDKPQGPYVDHGPMIGQDAGSIDPVPVTDENGVRYLVWKEDGNSRKQPTPIWAQQLSPDGTKLIGEMHELIRNDVPWEGNLVEGAFVLKHGDYFYMFYSGNACCGRACTYGLGVARAKRLLGPWEKNPANPVIEGNDTWKCPGHGSIVSDPAGHDYLMYHAYSAKDFIYVGRQALLDRVEWQENGWPRLSDRTPSVSAPAPLKKPAKHAEDRFFDDFRSKDLRPEWQWPQANEPVVRKANDGGITLSANHDHQNDSIGAVLAIKTTSGSYVATTELNLENLISNARAGLSAYGDHANALGVSMRGGVLSIWKRQNNKEEIIASAEIGSSKRIQLRMSASEGHKFTFSSNTGKGWNPLAPEIDIEGAYLPPWDRGIRAALTVGGPEGASATFNSFKIEPAAN
jgi:xylan 1,4-beta-xylosidase